MFTSAQVVKRNYEAWCSHNGLSKYSLATSKKIKISTVQRVVDGTTAITLSTLDELAAVTGLQAWQLLYPDFDPSNPPTIPISTSERKLYAMYKQLKHDVLEAYAPHEVHEEPAHYGVTRPKTPRT